MPLKKKSIETYSSFKVLQYMFIAYIQQIPTALNFYSLYDTYFIIIRKPAQNSIETKFLVIFAL